MAKGNAAKTLVEKIYEREEEKLKESLKRSSQRIRNRIMDIAAAPTISDRNAARLYEFVTGIGDYIEKAEIELTKDLESLFREDQQTPKKQFARKPRTAQSKEIKLSYLDIIQKMEEMSEHYKEISHVQLREMMKVPNSLNGVFTMWMKRLVKSGYLKYEMHGGVWHRKDLPESQPLGLPAADSYTAAQATDNPNGKYDFRGMPEALRLYKNNLMNGLLKSGQVSINDNFVYVCGDRAYHGRKSLKHIAQDLRAVIRDADKHVYAQDPVRVDWNGRKITINEDARGAYRQIIEFMKK